VSDRHADHAVQQRDNSIRNLAGIVNTEPTGAFSKRVDKILDAVGLDVQSPSEPPYSSD
jgi:hypothetical protein